MSLSEAFLVKREDGWMVDGEERVGEQGKAITCSDVGDSES